LPEDFEYDFPKAAVRALVVSYERLTEGFSVAVKRERERVWLESTRSQFYEALHQYLSENSPELLKVGKLLKLVSCDRQWNHSQNHHRTGCKQFPIPATFAMDVRDQHVVPFQWIFDIDGTPAALRLCYCARWAPDPRPAYGKHVLRLSRISQILRLSLSVCGELVDDDQWLRCVESIKGVGRYVEMLNQLRDVKSPMIRDIFVESTIFGIWV